MIKKDSHCNWRRRNRRRFADSSLRADRQSRKRSVVNKAFPEFGTIDVIVSNAGYGLFDAAEELSDEQVAHQLSTNLFGSIQLIRAALPHLRAQGSGRIIGLSTYGGQAALPGGSLYHASKWGLEGFLDPSPRNSLHSISAFRSSSRAAPARTSALAGRSLGRSSKPTRARRPRWSTP